MKTPIPILNIYFMLCYAWNHLEEGKNVDVGEDDATELVDLFAKVLISGLKHILRRGLDRGYVQVRDELSSIRGRLDFNRSMGLIVRNTPRMVCEFGELQHDILTNQILKASAERLVRVSNLDEELADELNRLLLSFNNVSAPRLSYHLFQKVGIHRNNTFYDFLIKLCKLIFECTLPEDDGKHYKFQEFDTIEKYMGEIFEDFVRNFYEIEQEIFEVGSPHLNWNVEVSAEQKKLLPEMRTDIYLKEKQGQQRRIIIDTKFYANTLQTHRETKKIHSDNLYQIFSYLAGSKEHSSKDTEGILLYPTVNEEVNFCANFQGHQIRVYTLNLNQHWQGIHNDLLKLIGEQ